MHRPWKENFSYIRIECCNKLQRCYVLSRAQTQVQPVLLKKRHVTPWHHKNLKFKHFNTVFKHSYHLTRRTLFYFALCFPLGLQLQEDLNRKVAFSSLTGVYMYKLNVISYWHVSLGWLFFLSRLTFLLQTWNSM